MNEPERPITQDEIDELVLKYGTPAEKKRILEGRENMHKIGIGSKYGRQ